MTRVYKSHTKSTWKTIEVTPVLRRENAIYLSKKDLGYRSNRNPMAGPEYKRTVELYQY